MKQMRHAVQEEAKQCTFSPDREAADLAPGGPGGVGESKLERWERLAYQDWQRVQASRAASASQHYSQFTFQPHIDPNSRRIGQVHHLIRNARSLELRTHPQPRCDCVAIARRLQS